MKSRLSVSNPETLVNLLRDHRERAAEQCVRTVWAIRSAPENWLVTFAQQHGFDYFRQSSMIDRSDRITALLGSEREAAVMQLGLKPDLGLLAAMAGTVRQGGICVLGMPGADSVSADQLPSNSLKRLEALIASLARQHPDYMMVMEYSDMPALNADGPGSHASKFNSLTLRCTDTGEDVVHPVDSAPNPAAVAEQQALLDKAYGHIAANHRSCIMIAGRRGRGKSSLMARLALKLAQQSGDIKITALHESALSAYRKVAGATGDYLSPESAVIEPIDILLVDEAASFSITQLQHYARNSQHLILSTTLEGYETAGRALALRLHSHDFAEGGELLQLEPVHPWRWSVNDPLERLIDRLLLSPAAISAPDPDNTAPHQQAKLASRCAPRPVSRDELLADESLLGEVQALLSSTHYQSSTKDLEHLLDAPTIRLWIQQLDRAVTGVLLLEHEGVIDESLHDAILTKRRRIPNQLLPQLLAQSANSAAALTKPYIRVLRLAITPALRRQGLGSALLKLILQSYTSTDGLAHADKPCKRVSAIGASFAADAPSVSFWHSHGFEEFHRGFKTNPRTGKRAVTVMQCYDRVCADVLEKAVRIHRDNERSRRKVLSCNWQTGNVNPDKAEMDGIRSSGGETRHEPVLTNLDLELLARFAAGQRSLHDTHAAIHRLTSISALTPQQDACKSHRQYEQRMQDFVQHWLNTHEAHF